MRFYTLDTVFSFGQHQGETVAQVLATAPGYLNFCMQALDHFALRRAEAETWQTQYPAFGQQFTPQAWERLDEKEAEHQAQLERQRRRDEADDYDSSDEYSAREAERDTFDALTDGQYGDYDDFDGDMDGLRDALGW